jgi:hypothetical protein
MLKERMMNGNRQRNSPATPKNQVGALARSYGLSTMTVAAGM